MSVPDDSSPRDFLCSSEFSPDRANRSFPHARNIMLGALLFVMPAKTLFESRSRSSCLSSSKGSRAAEYLRKAAERLEKQGQDRERVMEFTHFVRREDSASLPAIWAIFATGSHGDAAEFLGMTDAGFVRVRTRLRQLGGCFVNGETVPRQRKPYTKRRRAAATRKLAAAA